MNIADVDAAEVNSELPAQEAAGSKPRWVAFGVILGVILVLVIAPIAIKAAVPPKIEGSVGVYERITLFSEPGDEGVLGGFIAPQGWLIVDSAEEESSNEKPTRSFETQDGGVRVTASVYAPIESAEQLLRDGAPIGAAMVPIQRLESAPLLTADVLEYDLGAGSGVNQRIAVCEVLQNYSCLLFEVEVSGNRVGSDASPLLPDVAEMVASAEVLPGASRAQS